MAVKQLNRTTLSIATEVRNDLKHIARKDQTYNELFIDLITRTILKVKIKVKIRKKRSEGRPEPRKGPPDTIRPKQTTPLRQPQTTTVTTQRRGFLRMNDISSNTSSAANRKSLSFLRSRLVDHDYD